MYFICETDCLADTTVVTKIQSTPITDDWESLSELSFSITDYQEGLSCPDFYHEGELFPYTFGIEVFDAGDDSAPNANLPYESTSNELQIMYQETWLYQNRD